MENERSYDSGFSAIGVTAAISVFVLVAATGWEIRSMVHAKNVQTSYVASDAKKDVGVSAVTTGNLVAAASTSSTSPAAGGASESALGTSILEGLVSKYTSLQQQGIYTQEVGQKVAEKMAADLKPEVSYTKYAASDIHTDPNTTDERALSYQRDLQKSLAPLLKNTQPEFEIFAYYVSTKDEKYLVRLKEVAQYYRDAASSGAQVTVPQDAALQHVALLNALLQFAATLDAIAANANDPFASAALLRTYNQAEADMVTSVTALTIYYKEKNT